MATTTKSAHLLKRFEVFLIYCHVNIEDQGSSQPLEVNKELS